jgi:hypothetical protein
MLLRVPSLDAGMFQPRILSPMRGIDPALGVHGAADTLTLWAHGDLVDLWKPVEPSAPESGAAPKTAAGPKPAARGRARGSKRSAAPAELQLPPDNGADLIQPARLAGAGDLRLANQTGLEAVVKLVTANGAMVRALYLAPNGTVNIRPIAIGVYTLHVELGRDLAGVY